MKEKLSPTSQPGMGEALKRFKDYGLGKMSCFLIFTAKIIQKKFPEFLCAFEEKKCVKLCGYAMFEVGSSSSVFGCRAEVCMTCLSPGEPDN